MKTNAEYLREWRERNPGRLAELRRRFLEKHPGYEAARYRKVIAKKPEYYVWASMKARCLNSTRKEWRLYGGRGIQVCDRWVNSFRDFLSDMGPRPSKQHSLDRINNNGNYEPSNCRWATRSQQNENRRPFKRAK